MNVAESLLHSLKAHGASEIFGIPGDFALPFFKVIEESGILPFTRSAMNRALVLLQMRQPDYTRAWAWLLSLTEQVD